MAPSKPTPTVILTRTPRLGGAPTTYLGIPHLLTILPGRYGTSYEIISTFTSPLTSSLNFDPAISTPGPESISDASITQLSGSSFNPTATGSRGGRTVTFPDGTEAEVGGGSGSGGGSKKMASESVRAGVGIGVVGFVLLLGLCVLIWMRRRGRTRD
jgi:hypothetical protein